MKSRECLDTRKAGGCSGYVNGDGVLVQCADCPAAPARAERPAKEPLTIACRHLLSVYEMAGALVQHINEGAECPLCDSDEEHDEDCQVGHLYDVLAVPPEVQGRGWPDVLAEVVALTADRDTAIARAVAAEQRAAYAEGALAELRPFLNGIVDGGWGSWAYPEVERLRPLVVALRATSADLAEALRRELRAEGLSEAADHAAQLGDEWESLAPDDRPALDFEDGCARVARDLRKRAAELRGPK